MKKFKVGDKIVCSINGYGTITDIIHYSSHPILCAFSHSDAGETYTLEGRMYSKRIDLNIRHLTPLEELI